MPAEARPGEGRLAWPGRPAGRALLRHGALRNLLILIAAWEVLGQAKLVAGGALPALSDILVRLWIDRADYPGHVWATVQASVLGFLIGNVLAIGAGVLFVLFPRIQRLARGVNIAVFALPPIAIAPILVLTLSGLASRWPPSASTS